MAFTTYQIRSARRHLRAGDPVMRRMIDEVGPFTLQPQRDRFGMLVRSIISQQISTKAASSIRKRLETLVAPAKITAQSVLQHDLQELRSAGLSPQKARYLHDLAEKVVDGTVQLRTIGRQSDGQVIDQLTRVTGIGHWTAQMFLIFALGRLDVFPHDDLGVRMALRDRYGLNDLPSKLEGMEIACKWRPFATVGSWYCWRSVDLQRQTNGQSSNSARQAPR